MRWRMLAVVVLFVEVTASSSVVGAKPPPSVPPAVGTSLPADFPEILDASTGQPILGYGASGMAVRTPVIFLHGNNDTPFPTACNPFGTLHNLAQYFADRGYGLNELWGLGYQGDQCDLIGDPTIRSSVSHTAAANVLDLRRFVHAVLGSTGAKRVDIVGHSLGVTLAREWMRQDDAHKLVRRVVGAAAPNHGIINCSPDPLNYWQLAANGEFTPTSAVCHEFGTADSPLLATLNAGDETPGRTKYLMLRNSDADFVYLPLLDGLFPGVPAQDANGVPHDFSESPFLEGACNITLTGQGAYDPFVGTGHLGIANSPDMFALAFRFLRRGGVRPLCERRRAH